MSPASLLFGAYRRQALSALLLNPDREFHVRELSRVTATSAGTMHKELSRLAQAGILRRRASGNQALYSANPASPIFEDLRNILRKTSGAAIVIGEAMRRIADRIAVAFVYGSIARGDETAASDVDLMIVGEVAFLEVVDAIQPAQEQLLRDINPTVYSVSEFKRKAREPGTFLQRVVADKKLFVVGGEHDLGELVENKSTPGPSAHHRGAAQAISRGRAAGRRRKV